MAVRPSDVGTLELECEARRQAGFDVTWLDGSTLRDRWGLVGLGAIESAAAASVDPYRLCARALATSAERGARIFDRTEVVDYELRPRSARLATRRGPVITATHVVVASGYEVQTLLPDLPLRLHTSFALVTEPMPELDRRYPDGLLFWDHDDPYLYGRVTDDQRLLVGGRDEPYRDPLRRRRALPTKTAALARSIPKRLPELADAAADVEVAYSWAGTFAETPDGLAYLGRHSAAPRCRFALGFGGNGITYSAIAAEYLADDIEGTDPHPAAELFALERPITEPS